MRGLHLIPSKIDLPLLETYFVGIILILAGLSFLIPNKMPPWSKYLLMFCFVTLGGFYIYISVALVSELLKVTSIRIILGFTGASIFIMNLAFSISSYYIRKANKLIGYERRRDD